MLSMRRTTPGVVWRLPVRVVSADQVLLQAGDERPVAPGRSTIIGSAPTKLLRPLPASGERACLTVPRKEPGEGQAAPPHPTVFVEQSALPSPPKRGEGALTTAATSRLARSLVEQREGPQRRSIRHVSQVRIATALRVDAAKPADHGDVLLAVFLPGDGLADDAGGSLEAPQHFAVLGVERLKLAGQHAGEHEIARRHHGGGVVRAL